MKIHYDDIFCLAYGNGKLKEWSKEKIIINTLYETDNETQCYLKVLDVTLFRNYDSKDDEWFRYSFGYQFRFPKTQVDLCVNIKTGKMKLEKVGVGYGYDDVESEIYKFIKNQIKLKNIVYRTNLNSQEFLVK
jgi:hypothetical protein